jgi:hypothetical protein
MVFLGPDATTEEKDTELVWIQWACNAGLLVMTFGFAILPICWKQFRGNVT